MVTDERPPTQSPLLERQGIAFRLLVLPAEIHQAEGLLAEAEAEFRASEFELETREAALLTGGVITGKNAEERKALLFEQTCRERGKVEGHRQNVEGCRRVVRHLLNEFSALKAIARLLGGAE